MSQFRDRGTAVPPADGAAGDATEGAGPGATDVPAPEVAGTPEAAGTPEGAAPPESAGPPGADGTPKAPDAGATGSTAPTAPAAPAPAAQAPAAGGADGGGDSAGDGSAGDGSGGDGPGGPAPGPLRLALAMVREAVVVVAIALVLSLLIKTFLFQAFFIPSASMENTLLVGDRVLVSKLTPGPFELKRGDIVVFEDPGQWLTAPPPRQEGPVRSGIRSVLTFVGLLPADSSDHLIKRVIGLPGDRIECCDDEGRLIVNGEPVDEAYVYPGDEPSTEKFSVTVPAGRLWVMGDHRSLSQDSRFHRDEDDGTVALDDVVGRAFVIVWPFGNAGGLDRAEKTFAGVPER